MKLGRAERPSEGGGVGPRKAAEPFTYTFIHPFNKHLLDGRWRSRWSKQGGSSSCSHETHIDNQNTQAKQSVTGVMSARQNVLPIHGEEDGVSLAVPLRGGASWRSSLEALAKPYSPLLFIPCGFRELIPAWSCLPFRTGDPQFQIPNVEFFAKQPPNSYSTKLRGKNFHDVHCHVEGVLCPRLGMTQVSPKVHCDWRMGPEGRSLQHGCVPWGVLVGPSESLSQGALMVLCF